MECKISALKISVIKKVIRPGVVEVKIEKKTQRLGYLLYLEIFSSFFNSNTKDFISEL